MPFRFRKSLKILPGVKLNLSKSGISTSIGKRGARLNIGKRGVKTTVGVPGTGISYTTGGQSASAKPKRKGCCGLFAVLPMLLLLIVILAR